MKKPKLDQDNFGLHFVCDTCKERNQTWGLISPEGTLYLFCENSECDDIVGNMAVVLRQQLEYNYRKSGKN
jgi:hypothetical protein